LRIAYVITRSDEIGGAHIHVRDLARWMKAQGHEVCVFVGGHGPFTELLNSSNILFHSLKQLKRPIRLFSDWRAIDELVQSLDDYQPDLVTLHSAKVGLLGRIACKKLAVPVIFTAHGWSFAKEISQPARFIYRLLERWTAPMLDKLVTVCETDRQYALCHILRESEQIVAVYNGIPDIGSVLLAKPVNKIARIVMVARFEKPKDHSTLIMALDGLKDLKWKLVLVGDGPLLDDARSIVKQFDLEDSVEFLGRRNDVAEILSEVDVFVLSSSSEGFPMSILEAMRASLPVVASAVGGVSEAVDDAETGFLVEAGNVDQIRERLRLLIQDAGLRKRLGNNARIKYEESFTFDKMAKKTLDIYESILLNR